ncbi:MAG: hypothetical protein CMH81_04840 [Nitrospiraceae bacterium]|nr:hypothetical protein [Nitrospiraceae bacterium]
MHNEAKKTQTYFLHIPKTAGTSLRSVIEEQFSKDHIAPFSYMHELADIVKRDKNELANYSLFAGHLGHTLIALLPQVPRVITMIREPVSRTISRFKNLMRNRVRKSVGHERFLDPNVTIEDFLSFPPTRRLITNFQVRNLAIDFDLTQTYYDDDGKEILPKQAKLLSYTTTNMSDDELLEKAKQRLASFEFVGITDRFAESMELLLATFGWTTTMDVPHLNALRDPALTEETLSHETIAQIESYTSLDSELYRFATALFEQRYAATFHQQ